MSRYDVHLVDLISKEKLDEILRVFTEVTGIASIITDTDGRPITDPHNFTSFCLDYCRSTEEGLRRCYESDRYGGQESARSRKRFIYKCLNAGLTDFATPIIVEGRHLGNVLGGQVLTEPADPAKAVENARSIAVTDADGYLRAMEKLPSMSHQRVQSIANLMEVITHTISELAFREYLSHQYSQLYLNKLVNSVSDCIISTDVNTTITMVNEACMTLFGCEEKELVGRSALTLFSDEISREAYRKQMNLSLARGKGRAILTAAGADGQAFPVQMSLARISDETGVRSGFVAVLRDVTEEKNMERMKEDLIGMLTHDMGNHVLSIQKALQLLLDGVLEPLNPKQTEVMTLALGTSHQLFGMVTDFLDIYRDENGRFLLYKSMIDMNQVIKESINHLLFLAQDKGISVLFEPCSPSVDIPGDRLRLMRTCTNLLENAIKYSPNGAKLRVFSSRVDGNHENAEGITGQSCVCLPQAGQQYLLVTVSDEGPGIPDEYRQAIFDKFFTIPSRNERRRKGMGLGLAFCKLVVEAHGGLIWLESRGADGEKSCQGCRFHFLLPASYKDNKKNGYG